MGPRAKRTQETRRATGNKQPEVFYRINSLLRIMRVIEQHEEQLCTIMNDIKISGAVSAAVANELHNILDEIPSSEYQEDLNAVREALGSTLPELEHQSTLASAAKQRPERTKRKQQKSANKPAKKAH